MLVSSKIVERVCGTSEVLISAIRLIDMPGIYVDENVQEVVYFHMLFDRHEVVFSEGAPSESLFTGPCALNSISQAAREEVFTLFPELRDRDYTPLPARLIPTGALQKKFVSRHSKNNKPVLSKL